MTPSQEAREYPPLPPMDIQEVACEYGEVPEPDAPMLDVGYSADAMRSYVDADRKARQQEALWALSFFASCIKSGEPWTDECQRVYDAATLPR